MQTRRMGGLALAVLGGCLTVTGIVGLAFARSPKTPGRSAATPTTTSGQALLASPTLAVESPATFLSELASAIRTGDVTFLVSRLHPAVIQRFGIAACQAKLNTTADPTARFTVQSVSAPTTYTWTTDTRTTQVPDTISVAVTRVSFGQTSSGIVHIAAVNGQQRWFTNCRGGA